MSRRFVDLSVPIENDVKSDPPGLEPFVEYRDHKQTAPIVAKRYDGLAPEGLLDGEGYAIEFLKLNTHNGTHVDAPWHFASTMDRGKPAAKIDEIPLDWFFGLGVKLDFRHFEDGHVVSAAEVEAELKRIGHELKPYDIVMVNTSAGKRFGNPDYVQAGCGMGKEATLYLTSRGIRVTGTDCWSWDAHFSHMAKSYAKTKDVAVIWEGHKSGREIGYCHIEKLHNLEVLPPHGFTVSCFPVKVKGGSAGWTRAVAIFDS
jgi:kynurenine formamidase